MEQKISDLIDKIVPDTSVIIEGLLSEKLNKDEIKTNEIVIHEAVIAELEHQANMGKAIGFLGLDELKRIKQISEKKGFQISFHGARPRAADIRHASLGEIDALIRDLAWEQDATLVTSDKVQSEVGLAKGMKIIYFKKLQQGFKKLKLERFFDEITMSVHLRENVPPYAKKGIPGKWEFRQLRKAVLKQDEIQDISREIIEDAKLRKDAFIEIERFGSTIVQLGNFRIVITRPPFSDGWEITAVRPVRKLQLNDYKLSDKLMKRVSEQAEGILVAGAPGMGKSTFAAALAEYYASTNKIIKTVEAPRDMILPENITQYAISLGDSQEIHDILLLSRPDYTIFDEMRDTKDFELFADLRLAGVGMVGVVHATKAIDAIQRFLGRIEMGVIPQIVDTVLFIKNGFIDRVLSLEMTVKVPSGMTEADLARPVVEVHDFENGKLAYEIYSYGEQTVVVPVMAEQKKSGAHKLALQAIEREFRNYSDNPIVEMLSDNKCVVHVPERDIARIIGKQGANISRIEEKLGISIEVRGLEEKEENQSAVAGKQPASGENEIPFELNMKSKQFVFDVGMDMSNKDIDIYAGNEYVLSAKSGKTGIVKIKKNNPIGKKLMMAVNSGEKIRIVKV